MSELQKRNDRQAVQLAVVRGWMARHCREPGMEAHIRELSDAMVAAAAGPEQPQRYEFAGSTTWIERVERRCECFEEWQRKFERRLEEVEAVTTRPQDVP